MEIDAQRMNKQIDRDAEVARIYAEEELQMMINSLDMSNEIVLKYLQEYKQFAEDLSIGERVELINDLIKYQENYAQILKYQTQQRKPWSKKQKRDYYMAIIKSNLGWKESVKKLKTSEEVKASEEVPKDKVKKMMQLVPIEEVYIEALQVKHLIIDWKGGFEPVMDLSEGVSQHQIQVAQKKVKQAFENADSSSRVELIPSKIKYANKPGSYYSFGQVPSHIGRPFQTTIETQHDVDGIVDQNILNRGKRQQLPSKYPVTTFTTQPPTTMVPK
nr:hypothetical protein [Tanacetum cinerariifolium]